MCARALFIATLTVDHGNVSQVIIQTVDVGDDLLLASVCAAGLPGNQAEY